MPDRHLLLVAVAHPAEGEDDPGASVLSTTTLGSRREIVRMLRHFNTAPDNDASSLGVLWGPGITVQLPMVDADDPVMQIMVTLTDETIAWDVLERVCRTLGWKVMDPKTGSIFSL